MLRFADDLRVYLYREPIDFRCGINTLAALVEDSMQMDPLARERSTWSLIPSFAERRMAAGRPISLLGGTSDGSEYAERSARVKTMYQTGDARQAWDIARSLRIEYIWADSSERRAYGSGVAKFDAHPELFAPVFTRGEVRIYRVH